MRNPFIINALQNLLFCIPKAAVLHGKSIGFALQKSRFRNAKSKLPLFSGIIFTKRRCFWENLTLNEWEKNSIATTTAERFLCNLPKKNLWERNMRSRKQGGMYFLSYRRSVTKILCKFAK
ncbi:hypothetical protein CTM53_03950 [Prevotella intermedia]|uniref:Uncharacterized protein n=1 Tax=Prevotella intermedia TaxID=28131 RepID=A0AAJ3RTD0_PREIN|nr:hypothetical protein CTM61_05845 [Prevotella intermedia]PJI20044.1 hypothetical protein CTM53_03950 [Prevotella intermedia]